MSRRSAGNTTEYRKSSATQRRVLNTKPDGTLTVAIRYRLNGKQVNVPANTLPKFKTEVEIIKHMNPMIKVMVSFH